MFEFKRFMIADDSWQNHAMRSRKCKQIWRAPRLTISVAFEILVSRTLKILKPMRTELRDILQSFDSYLSHFILCQFSSSSFLTKLVKTAYRKTITHFHPLVQTVKTIMSNFKMSKLHDGWWQSMTVHDNSRSNACDHETIINYHDRVNGA